MTSTPVVARAPTDVLRLIVALSVLVLTVVVALLFGDAIVSFAAGLLAGLDKLPDGLMAALAVLAQAAVVVVAVWAVVVMVRKRSWRLASAAVGAGVVGALLAGGLVHLVNAQAARVTDFTPVLAAGKGSAWSAAALGAFAAVVTAVAPWVSRPWRRAAWTTVVAVSLVSFVSNPVAFDTLLAVVAGWVAGSAVTVLGGAPSHRPTSTAIADGLRSVGIDLAKLAPAEVDARGSTPHFGETVDGQPLFVKALGDDERSADTMFRLYRLARRRELGDERPFSTLRRAVEHEALLSLSARDIGVRTPRLVAFARAEPDAFVLAYEAIDGRSLDRLEPDELSDEMLRATWEQLGVLRGHRIAHRDLRLANLFVGDDGVVWLIDFGFSELAASDLLLATDVAELLASSATSVGPDRALAAGRAALGVDVVRSARDRLELPLLSGATRTAMKADPALLPHLRELVSGTTV